jgi:hypothetical protein
MLQRASPASACRSCQTLGAFPCVCGRPSAPCFCCPLLRCQCLAQMHHRRKLSLWSRRSTKPVRGSSFRFCRRSCRQGSHEALAAMPVRSKRSKNGRRGQSCCSSSAVQPRITAKFSLALSFSVPPGQSLAIELASSSSHRAGSWFTSWRVTNGFSRTGA